MAIEKSSTQLAGDKKKKNALTVVFTIISVEDAEPTTT